VTEPERARTRAGLTPERVVAEAGALADERGIHALSLAPLAERLGVRVPSLYKHVGGLDDLHQRLAAQGASGLSAAVEEAARGRKGRDALLAISAAYRRYAIANHGCYQALARISAAYPQRGAAVDALLRRIVAELGLSPADARRAAHAVRSALHGFVVLEAAGGFGTADTDASFHALIALLDRGLATAPRGRTHELRLPTTGTSGR
jgi:AcrR family transcriptional regulator